MSQYTSVPGSALEEAPNVNAATLKAIQESRTTFDRNRETTDRIIKEILNNSEVYNTEIITASTSVAIDTWVTNITRSLDNIYLPEEEATRSIKTIKQNANEKKLIITTSFKSNESADIMKTSGFDNDCLIHAILQALSQRFRTLKAEYKNAIASIFRRKILVDCVIVTLKKTDDNILTTNIATIFNLFQNEIIANNELFNLSTLTLNDILRDNINNTLNKFVQLCTDKINRTVDNALRMKYGYLKMLIHFATTRLLTDAELTYITNKYSFCAYVYDVASKHNEVSPWTEFGNNCQQYILLYNPQDKALHYETIRLLPNMYVFSNDFIKEHFQPAKQSEYRIDPAALLVDPAVPPAVPPAVAQSLVNRQTTPAASSTQISIAQQPTIYKATLNNDGSVKIYNTDGNEVNYNITENRNTPLTFTVKQIIPS